MLSLVASATPTFAQTSQFKPNSKISSGNSYQGVSISGVGGAIASCTNIGSFLVNTASSFLSNTSFGKSSKAQYGGVSGSNDTVPTTDKKTQDKLDSQIKTTNCLDGIAYAVAKNTLAQVTNKTLNWVNTGLNGNPLYVQNAGSFLQSISNKQINAFLKNAPKSDSIFGNALESTLRQSITGVSDGLINVAVNSPQAKQYSSFMGDFTNGGWNSLLNPSYNSVGAVFNATDALRSVTNTLQQDAVNEIQRNAGFLDMKHCVQTSSDINTTSTKTAVSSGLSSTPTCVKWVTDTPGSIIASQVQAITTSPIRQLEYANKINEVLGSFFDSFVNNLLQKGLRGSSSGKVDFGLDNVSSGDNTVAGANDLAALGYQAATGGDAISQNFDISRPQQFKVILQTQYDFLNRTMDAQASLKKIIPNLGALDYCIPGPNPNWNNGGATANLDALTGALVRAAPKGAGAFQSFQSHEPLLGSQLNAVIELFTHSDDAPPIWTTQGILSDPITGGTIQIPRIFYTGMSHNYDDENSGVLANAYHTAYKDVANKYSWWTTPFTDSNNFTANPVQRAFVYMNGGDPSFAQPTLAETYTNLYSLLAYNRAAATIDDQYDTNIGETNNNIIQMNKIRAQINAIVSKAKADYIAKRASDGDPVNMACIDNAYQIDNDPINGVKRLEGPEVQDDPTVPAARKQDLRADDAILQHSIDSSNFFYRSIAI